jgi:hypothetical protein
MQRKILIITANELYTLINSNNNTTSGVKLASNIKPYHTTTSQSNMNCVIYKNLCNISLTAFIKMRLLNAIYVAVIKLEQNMSGKNCHP